MGKFGNIIFICYLGLVICIVEDRHDSCAPTEVCKLLEVIL